MSGGASALTLEGVQQNRALMQDLAARVDMELADSYEQFTDCVDRVMDSIITYLEADPGVRLKDSEDRLTVEIIGSLCQRGFNASHDTKHGGHTDIYIKHRQGYVWLGEAKKHKSYAYLLQGFNQLCSRYANGTPEQGKGGLLIYIRVENAADVMENWKKYLTEQKLAGFVSNECGRGSFTFITSHTHVGSGVPYQVRHMAVLQYFNPKDK